MRIRRIKGWSGCCGGRGAMRHFHTGAWTQHEASSASTIGLLSQNIARSSVHDRQTDWRTQTKVSLVLLALPGSKVKAALIGRASLGWFFAGWNAGEAPPPYPPSQTSVAIDHHVGKTLRRRRRPRGEGQEVYWLELDSNVTPIRAQSQFYVFVYSSALWRRPLWFIHLCDRVADQIN